MLLSRPQYRTLDRTLQNVRIQYTSTHVNLRIFIAKFLHIAVYSIDFLSKNRHLTALQFFKTALKQVNVINISAIFSFFRYGDEQNYLLCKLFAQASFS